MQAAPRRRVAFGSTPARPSLHNLGRRLSTVTRKNANPEPEKLPEAVAWKRGGLRGHVLPGYKGLDPAAMPWEAARAGEPLPDGVELAKRSRSRLVLADRRGEETLYYKRLRPYRLSRRASAMLLGPKTLREWKVGRRFLAAGILVPVPVLYAAGPEDVTYLVTRSLPSSWHPVDEIVSRDGIDGGLLDDLAELTRWLHALPALHGDYRADHIWATDSRRGAPIGKRFAFIDLDGSDLGDAPSTRQRAKALHELFQSLAGHGLGLLHIERFVAAYDPASAYGLDPARIYERALAEHHRKVGPAVSQPAGSRPR